MLLRGRTASAPLGTCCHSVVPCFRSHMKQKGKKAQDPAQNKRRDWGGGLQMVSLCRWTASNKLRSLHHTHSCIRTHSQRHPPNKFQNVLQRPLHRILTLNLQEFASIYRKLTEVYVNLQSLQRRKFRRQRAIPLSIWPTSRTTCRACPHHWRIARGIL